MFQRITIVGRLGRDPEMRYTNDGTAVATLNVATDRSYTDRDGQRQKQTIWFRVSVWRRQAETCNQYLSKGRMVLIEGEMQEPTPYQGRDGEWRASLSVNARNVVFLGGRDDQGSGGGQGGGGGQGYGGGGGRPQQNSPVSGVQNQQDGPDQNDEFMDEEEIPF